MTHPSRQPTLERTIWAGAFAIVLFALDWLIMYMMAGGDVHVKASQCGLRQAVLAGKTNPDTADVITF